VALRRIKRETLVGGEVDLTRANPVVVGMAWDVMTVTVSCAVFPKAAFAAGDTWGFRAGADGKSNVWRADGQPAAFVSASSAADRPNAIASTPFVTRGPDLGHLGKPGAAPGQRGGMLAFLPWRLVAESAYAGNYAGFEHYFRSGECSVDVKPCVKAACEKKARSGRRPAGRRRLRARR